jgi:WhiB family redox-sensing transcriptional regulator
VTNLVDLLLDNQGWKADALCKEYPLLSWFPRTGEPNDKQKAVCQRCLVRADCLQSALDNYEIHGIWGGTSQRELKDVRTEKNGGIAKECWCGRKMMLISQRFARQGLTRSCGLYNCRPRPEQLA